MTEPLAKQLEIRTDVRLGSGDEQFSLQVTGFKSSRNSDTVSGDFQVDIPGPKPEFDSAEPSYVFNPQLGTHTWTNGGTPVEIDLVVGGETFPVVRDARVKSANENVNSQDVVSSSIAGYTDNQTEILKIAPQRDIYFVSADWLNEKWGPTGWKLSDGRLVTATRDLISSFNRGTPLVDPDLPNKDAKPDTFEIIISTPTQHQIGLYIAQRLGMVLVSNVPNMEILKVRKLESSKSYWQAIQDLYAIWNAEFKLVKKNEKVYLYVIDVCGESATLQRMGSLKVPPGILEAKGHNEQRSDVQTINHVQIKGAKRKLRHQTFKNFGMSTVKTLKLSPMTLSEDKVMSYISSYEEGYDMKQKGEYHKGFDSPNAKNIDIPKFEHCTDYYHINKRDPSKWILVREERAKYSHFGEILSRVSIEHKYAAGYKLVQTIEREYGWLQWPGQPFERFENHTNRIILQDEIIADVNVASKVEIVEQLILVERMIDRQSGEEYYAAAKPLNQATLERAVQQTPRTRQEVIEMTTKTKHNNINRVTPQVLRQIEVEYDRISGTSTTRSDIIANPFKGDKGDSEESQYTKDFYDGAGPYLPALVIEHPDINSDALAQQVAHRVFAKNKKDRRPEAVISLTCLVPLPILSTDMTVTIEDIPYHALNRGLWEDRVIPGGTYVLKKITIGADSNGPNQTLELSNSI